MSGRNIHLEIASVGLSTKRYRLEIKLKENSQLTVTKVLRRNSLTHS